MSKLARVVWCYLNFVLLLIIAIPLSTLADEWSQVANQEPAQPITPPQIFSPPCWTERGMAIVGTVLGLFIAFYFIGWLWHSYCCDPVDTKTSSKACATEEIEYMAIQCNNETADYEYYVAFRVGCPSPNFDMTNGWIEFALLMKGNEPIGIPVIFSCSTLADRTYGQFLLQIGRMTPMPDIVGVLARHNQADNAYIYLYEFALYDSEEDLIETRPIREYIKREPTKFRPLNEDDDHVDYVYPALPPVEWSTIEMLLVAGPLLLSLGAFVMLVEQWNLYPDGVAHQDGSLHRSLFNVLYSVPVSGLLLIGIIAGLKFTINLKIQHSTLSSNPNDDQYWWRVAKMIVIVLSVLQTVLSSVVLVFGSYLLLLVNALYWLCSVLVVWVCAIGLWLTLEASIYVRYYFEGSSAIDHELAEWYRRNNAYANNDSIDGNKFANYAANSNQTVPQAKQLYMDQAQTTTRTTASTANDGHNQTILKRVFFASTASNIKGFTPLTVSTFAGPKFAKGPAPIKHTKIAKQSKEKLAIQTKVPVPVPKRSAPSDDHKQEDKSRQSNVIHGKIKRKLKHSTTKLSSLNKFNNNKRTKVATSLKVNRANRAKVTNRGVVSRK